MKTILRRYMALFSSLCFLLSFCVFFLRNGLNDLNSNNAEYYPDTTDRTRHPRQVEIKERWVKDDKGDLKYFFLTIMKKEDITL